jgi:hypothetical protein
MIDTDKYEGVRTPFGTVPMEDILKMLEPIRERDNKIAELDAEVKRLREDNKKLHDAINDCAYANKQGSALDLYCESIIERCPTCYQNIDDMECGCEEE